MICIKCLTIGDLFLPKANYSKWPINWKNICLKKLIHLLSNKIEFIHKTDTHTTHHTTPLKYIILKTFLFQFEHNVLWYNEFFLFYRKKNSVSFRQFELKNPIP